MNLIMRISTVGPHRGGFEVIRGSHGPVSIPRIGPIVLFSVASQVAEAHQKSVAQKVALVDLPRLGLEPRPVERGLVGKPVTLPDLHDQALVKLRGLRQECPERFHVSRAFCDALSELVDVLVVELPQTVLELVDLIVLLAVAQDYCLVAGPDFAVQIAHVALPRAFRVDQHQQLFLFLRDLSMNRVTRINYLTRENLL